MVEPRSGDGQFAGQIHQRVEAFDPDTHRAAGLRRLDGRSGFGAAFLRGSRGDRLDRLGLRGPGRGFGRGRRFGSRRRVHDRVQIFIHPRGGRRLSVRFSLRCSLRFVARFNADAADAVDRQRIQPRVVGSRVRSVVGSYSEHRPVRRVLSFEPRTRRLPHLRPFGQTTLDQLGLQVRHFDVGLESHHDAVIVRRRLGPDGSRLAGTSLDLIVVAIAFRCRIGDGRRRINIFRRAIRSVLRLYG